jgi:hypothetical protein
MVRRVSIRLSRRWRSLCVVHVGGWSWQCCLGRFASRLRLVSRTQWRGVSSAAAWAARGGVCAVASRDAGGGQQRGVLGGAAEGAGRLCLHEHLCARSDQPRARDELRGQHDSGGASGTGGCVHHRAGARGGARQDERGCCGACGDAGGGGGGENGSVANRCLPHRCRNRQAL